MRASSIKKRTIVIDGRLTRVSVEDAFWSALKEIATWRRDTLRSIVASINANRQSANLSCAIRVFVLQYYRDQLDRRGGIVVKLTER